MIVPRMITIQSPFHPSTTSMSTHLPASIRAHLPPSTPARIPHLPGASAHIVIPRLRTTPKRIPSPSMVHLASIPSTGAIPPAGIGLLRAVGGGFGAERGFYGREGPAFDEQVGAYGGGD